MAYIDPLGQMELVDSFIPATANMHLSRTSRNVSDPETQFICDEIFGWQQVYEKNERQMYMLPVLQDQGELFVCEDAIDLRQQWVNMHKASACPKKRSNQLSATTPF